jgi:protein O-mannosyl-transferase
MMNQYLRMIFQRQLRHPVLWVGLLLAAAVWGTFYPVLRHEFVNLDDPAYVTANPQVQAGLTWPTACWAFRAVHAGNWHPLTWLSHMLDTQFFGQTPAGPHLVNLLFHLANTLLLFLALRTMTGALWRPAFAAALFAVHPLRVESVAWVAERKDVLSGLFFMLALWAYARYAQGRKATAGEDGRRNMEDGRTPSPRPFIQSSGSKVRGAILQQSSILHLPAAAYYTLSLGIFALGLMSKPTLVTLPFVLLLDYWPLRRLDLKTMGSKPATVRALFREKIPFFALTAVSCVITFLAQKHGGAVQSMSDCPFGVRLENAVISYLAYLAKTVWPAWLATPYPDPHLWPLPLFGAATVLLAAMTVGAWWLHRRLPFIATGWLWFLGMLIPAIGIIQVGAQAMADRYTYLPLIGIFIMVAWGASEAFERLHFPSLASAAVAGLVLLACSVRTRDQLRYWQNSETLLSHAVAVTTNNWLAHYNLGLELDRQGRIDEALPHYRKVLAIKPGDTDALNNLGCALAKRKQYAEAIPCFETALRLKPGLVEPQYNLGRSLLQAGRTEEGIQHYQAFLRAFPEHAAAREELGVALALKGDLKQAVSEFREVLRLQPDNAEAHFNLGEALALQGKSDEAVAHLTEAVRLKPGWEDARRELRTLSGGGH